VSQELTLRIILREPPATVDFAIQTGHAAKAALIQKQRSTGTDLHFELPITLAPAVSGAPPDFRGPIVQGPKGQRFLYVNIGTSAGQWDSPWTRRLKVPLTGITWDMLEGSSILLQTQVPGTARDGSPTCATVKPFDGWKRIA
jgi:hypothetical protein